MKKIFMALLTLVALSTNAQTDSAKHSLKFSGYIEAYYSYDFATAREQLRHEAPTPRA